MYEYHDIEEMHDNAKDCTTKRVVRYGVQIFHDVDPDWCGADFVIDPEDKQALELYRDFCRKMADHYKTLLEKRLSTN